MSLSKVLNRPLFRHQALRKGVLKPLHASSGTMVGMNVPGGAQKYVQKGGGFYDPYTGRLVGGLPAKINTPQAPSWWSKFKSDMGGVGRNWKDPRFLLSAPFGMGGGLTRGAGSIGLYPLIEEGTRKLGMTGFPKLAADAAISYGLAKNPYAAGIGLLYGGYRASRPLVGRGVDLIKERPLGTTASNKDFMPGVEGALGDPIKTVSFEEMVKNNKGAGRWTSRDSSQTADSEAPKPVPSNMKQIASGRGSGTPVANVGYREFDNAVAGVVQPDQLTQPENETRVGNSTVVDLEKVVKNASLSEDENIKAPKDEGLVVAPGIEPSKPPAPVKENTLSTAQNIYNSSRDGKGTEKPIGGKLYTTDLVNRAKQIRSELGMEPQGDLARTTFLAQLAAGLLTGTTNKNGIGGALEVFGQALGPAVSNYAVMKLKQNELDNRSMETYLGYALDEMKLFNEAAAGEPFDGELGVVQFIDDNGNTINVKGRQTKSGTYEFATGQVGPRGNEIYAPISSQATVPGFGTVNDFFDKKTVDKETIKIGDTLSNRYKTFKITNDVLDTIAEYPKAVGPGGVVNLFKTRVGSALNDLGFSFGSSRKEAEAVADAYRAEIEASDLPEETKKKLLNSTKFDKLYNDAKRRITKAAKRKGETVDSETLESLAVAETTLVYALANSFKDKDRLTARDVAAAEKLVNLFTFTRGSASVEASIRAIGQQLQDDIIRYENDYRRVGGLERTLQNMRIQNQFRLQSGQTISDAYIKTFDREGLLEEYDK